MTLVSRISACALVALMGIPAVAQTARHRAVSPAAQSGPTTQVVITAKDAANGVPVESATVTYAAKTFTTTPNGLVAITLPVGKPSVITIDHRAFLPFSQS